MVSPAKLGLKSLFQVTRRARDHVVNPGPTFLARLFMAKQVSRNPAFCPLAILFHTHNPNPLALLAGDKKVSPPLTHKSLGVRILSATRVIGDEITLCV